jgi:phage/plasmid-associated DNA primase
VSTIANQLINNLGNQDYYSLDKIEYFQNTRELHNFILRFDHQSPPYAQLMSREISRGPRKGLTVNEYVPTTCDDIISSIADYLRLKLTLISDSHYLYVWNGVYYELWKDDIFSYLIEKLYRVCRWKYRKKEAKEIYQQMMDSHSVDPMLFNAVNDIIPFNNTWIRLNPESYEYEEMMPTPEVYLTYCINYEYKTEINCPLFQEKLLEIIPREEERIMFLAFIANSFLPRAADIKKFLLLYGPSNAGKSQLTGILQKIFINNTAGEKLENFTDPNKQDRSLYAIAHKLLNIGSEISESRLRGDAILKDLTGEYQIRVRQLYSEPINVKNITSHIFTANNIPPPPFNAGTPFYNRWIIITCDNVLPAEQRICNLVELLEQEIEGIIPYILSFSKHIPQLYGGRAPINKKIWNEKGLSQYAFITVCKRDPNFEIQIYEMYQIYKKWAQDKKYENVAPINIFGKTLHQEGVFTKQKTDGKRYYVGIKPPSDPKYGKYANLRLIVRDILALGQQLTIDEIKDYHDKYKGGFYEIKRSVLNKVVADLNLDGVIYSPDGISYVLVE